MAKGAAAKARSNAPVSKPPAKKVGMKAWAALAEAPSPRRSVKAFRPGSELEKTMWKKMRVNMKFPGMTLEQVRCLVNEDGCDLWSRLLADGRKAEQMIDEAPVFGNIYYDDLTAEFMPTNAPTNKLKIAHESELLDEELMVGLDDIQSYPKSWTRIMDYLAESDITNQKTYVVLSKQVLKTVSTQDPDSCAFLIAVLKFSKRTFCHTKYPETFEVLKPNLDHAVAQSYELCRLARGPLDIWWNGK